MKIGWTASVVRGNWLRLFSFKGQLEVPDDYTPRAILQNVQKAVLNALKIEWHKID